VLSPGVDMRPCSDDKAVGQGRNLLGLSEKKISSVSCFLKKKFSTQGKKKFLYLKLRCFFFSL
jgi:hypothetical protein